MYLIYDLTRKGPALCAGRHKVLQTFLQGCVTLQNYSKPLNSTISGVTCEFLVSYLSEHMFVCNLKYIWYPDTLPAIYSL